MKREKMAVTAINVAVVAFFALAATACKGRTMENMEPTGDTVEVVIDTTAEAPMELPVDSII
jgi:hypothetical protein